MAHTLTTEMTEEGIELRNHVYGLIATLSKVKEGECMSGMWLITWSNDAIGWGPIWRASLEAAEFTVLAYVYELEATGH